MRLEPISPDDLYQVKVVEWTYQLLGKDRRTKKGLAWLLKGHIKAVALQLGLPVNQYSALLSQSLPIGR